MHRLLFITLVLLAGCAPDITETDFFSRHPDPLATEEGKVILASHTNDSIRIRVLSENGLHAGFNPLLFETEGDVSELTATLFLDSGITRIESPLGSTVFTSGESAHILNPGISGDWTLELSWVTNQGRFTTLYPVEVADDIWVQQIEGAPTFISWIAPAAPKTGSAVFEIAIHSFDGRSFSPVTSASPDLYPYMDMGAGEGHSTPFLAPTHVGDGHYRGEVNFIMSGGWDMTVRMSGGEEVIFKGFTVR